MIRRPTLRSSFSILAAAIGCLSVARAASAQPAGALPAGLPAHLSVGLFEQNGQTWMKSSGVPWDLRYEYLVKGWSDNFGWGAHDGSFALAFMQEADAAKMIPVLTWYQMVGEPGGGEAQWSTVVQNTSTMRDYYGDFKLLLQRAKDFGKPVVIHLEPDGFGYLQRQTSGAAYAAVAASGLPELAGLPNTVAGFGLAFLQLRNAVGANNVILAVHVSSWASGVEVANHNVTDPLQPNVDSVFGFLKPLGLGQNQTGGTFDLVAVDPLDRDADYYRLIQNDDVTWDPSDTASTSSKSFNRYAEWLRLWNLTSGKRLILWQIPLGNSNQLNVYNNGNPREGYKDNRAEYFFAGGKAHAQKFADSGVVGLLFGAGATGQSTYTNDTYSDGQLFLKSRAGQFYATGGLALSASGGGVPAAPAFSSSTASVSVGSGAAVSIGASITDTGGALQNGVVDIEVHDANGVLVGQQTTPQATFAANQINTYSYAWQAPAAGGVYTVAIGVFGPNSTPRYHWNAAAGTITVAAVGADLAQYAFESGGQGWASTGGMLTGVSSTTARAFAGTHSLAISFAGKAADSRNVYVRSPAVAAGKTVSFHLWIPAGSQLSSVQAYVQQGSAGGWQWTGNWQSVAQLKTNAWNTISVTLPNNAAPLWELGLQIGTKAAWAGTAYLDSVSW